MTGQKATMLGWRKKREGFEWHDYVRTTILVRRANRRQKVDDARKAAAEGLKEAGAAAAHGINDARQAAAEGMRRAGKAGSALGASGISGTGALLGRLKHVLARAAAATWTKGGELFARFAAGSASVGGSALVPLLRQLADRRRRIAIGAAGIAALLGASYRIWKFGPDITAALIGGLAVAALALVAIAERERGDATQRVSGGNADAPQGPAPISMRLLKPALGWGTFAIIVVLGLGSLLDQGGGAIMQAKEPRTATAKSPPTPVQSSANAAATGDISGRAVAVTGDTLRIARRTVRLAHIAAPERSQSCQRSDGRRWQCGESARSALAQMVRGKSITCTLSSTGPDDSATGDCRLGDKDLAAELVGEGNVFAETGFFARYSSLEDEARQAGRGLWGGKAERPEDYRATAWKEAKSKAPDGCPIKGEPPSRGKRYVMPWSRGYDRMQVRVSRGGRWFCSEEEAREAGWRPSGDT
ncbi:MAG: thermonuclease family protein [Hyphomicrobiaceae bacterium]|nr:thermonuclease family protein [Hyphomicrobiaceae bacterium]